MTKKANSVTEALEQHMNKALLKHAAGTWMFCPKCETVLDWSTVIILDVFREKKTVHVSKQVVCTHCTKDLNTIDWAALETENNVQIEVTSKDFTR